MKYFRMIFVKRKCSKPAYS